MFAAAKPRSSRTVLDSSSAASAPRSSSAATVAASSRSVSVSCARPLVRLDVVDAQDADARAGDVDRHAEEGRDAVALDVGEHERAAVLERAARSARPACGPPAARARSRRARR